VPGEGGGGLGLDLSKYLGLFVSESRDHIEALSRALVALERAGGAGAEAAALVDGMFRHAHSVKGMAGTMQFEGIARLAHRAEDVIGALRGRGGPVGPDVVDALLGASDALLGMVQASAAGGSPPAPDGSLLERLERTAAALRAGPPPPTVPAIGGPAGPGAGGADPQPGARPVHVEVEVAESCPVPSVRGYLVLKRLASLGTVLAADPDAEHLRAGRMPERRLAATLSTAEGEEAVRRTLAQIADLSRIEVRAADAPAAPGGEAAPAPPGPAGPRPASVPDVRDPGPEPRGPDGEVRRTVRVRAEFLDDFLDAVGELLLATSRVRELGRVLPQAQRRSHDEGVDRLHAIVKDLHGKVMSARMTPLAHLADRLPRAARDLARRTGKQVDVAIVGADIEIDRSLLEDLADPVLHVLRNAVDHGLEPAAERIAAGKPATGRVSFAARRERDRIVVEIADDGRGMDPARLREAAVARGALTREAAAALPDAEALLLSCLPGVSTAREVTEVSGRGVGMDAVKRTVESLGGRLEIESQVGRGTRLTLRMPLTVVVQPVLLVRVGDEVLALPVSKVHGAAEVEMEGLDRSGGAPQLGFAGSHVPVHELAALLGFGDARASGRRSIVVADGEGGRVGLAVDQLLGQEEAVLKPLHRPLSLVAGLSAVTVLGTGRPVFVLDVARLVTA
jgi:two-component system chemotaxis sensor kinase CheA